METSHGIKDIWHEDCLPPKTRKALRSLANASWLKRGKWYLAGGTALALQVGHRSSVDLDFFTPRDDFATISVMRQFARGEWFTTLPPREGTLYGELLEAKASFIAYPFFVPKKPFHWYGAVPVLDVRDIAVMKIIAISQRGRMRDFFDLFWICKNQEALIDVVRRLPSQYPGVAHDYNHIIASLTYFQDAEQDKMPNIFFSATWNEVKKFFEKEAKFISKKLVL